MLAIVSAAATALVVAAAIAWPSIRVYQGAAPPEQFYRALPAPPPRMGQPVLGIAHNAGNNPATTAAAVAHGAAVIEIDVVMVRGTLSAGRAHGWWWLAEHVFRGKTLAQAWAYAAPAKLVQLDLQQSGRPVLDALIRFLRQPAARNRPVMVSTRDAAAIAYLRARLPAAVRLLLSVPFPHAVSRLHTDRGLVDAIDGITVFQGLVDADLVRWAHRHKLLVLAWTVDTADRLDQLLRLHVDGITTANLAILDALSD